MVVFAWKRKLKKSRLTDGVKIVTFYLALDRPENQVATLEVLRFSVFARKLSMTGSIRIFEKLHFTPKLRCPYSSSSNFQI